MKSAKPYNGHPNWNAWNVSLWINNDEGLYRLALNLLRAHSTVGGAAREFQADMPAHTPDGARWSLHSISLALASLKKEML